MIEIIQLPEEALRQSVKALRRFAAYELEPAIQRRMSELGERKEFLDEAQHDELLSLTEFSEHRTIERLEAEAALRQLEAAAPQLREAS